MSTKAPAVSTEGNGHVSEPVDAGYLTVDAALANAPLDLGEEDVEGVFGGKVRVRALTAAQQAILKQVGVRMSGRNTEVAFAEMERKQFQLGVIVPAWTESQVRALHATSGESFTRVCAVIDRLSGMSREALEDAVKRFPDTGGE